MPFCFHLKQKRHEIFVLLYATDTKQDLGKTQQILVTTKVFTVKTELRRI